MEYQNVYPGIDLVYYGNQGQLEHDFVVTPGADPASILLYLDGVKEPAITADGDLLLGNESIHLSKPVIYQEIGGIRQDVTGGYALHGNFVSFQVGDYNAAQPLIIDPILVYYTEFWGASGRRIAVDADGNAYIAGNSNYSNQATSGAFQAVLGGGGADAIVWKLDPSGGIVYATYLGGSGIDSATGIAVDAQGNAYMTGWTGSANFPIEDPFQASYGGGAINGQGFVTKLNPTGSALVLSTYLGTPCGGSGTSIVVDAVGNAFVTGYASYCINAFPIVNGFQEYSCKWRN